MENNPLRFYNELQKIRLTAAVLYDRGRALKRTHEELAEDLAPLHEQRSAMIKKAVEDDLAGVICAIKQYLNDALAHKETCQFILEKMKDSELHANLLEACLKDCLKEKGITEKMDKDFTATLVDGGITIR